MTEPTSAVEQAVQARIARVRAEADRKRQERAEFAAARTAGLGYRHAARLRNQAANNFPGSQEPPVEEAPVPAALRTVCCPACRCDRLARLMTTITVAGAPYDVLRCAADNCELLWLVRANRPRTAPIAA
ncbi:hypothetical protein ABZX77_17945 [Streptomyces sp. NPDC004237]|uniref:hypothetical protein n=1 Tax=Streptomyces sp. NPDC004237 TaxID=3154455 RepID=UPI0033BCDAF9